jgi:uncharacterized protein YukE
MANVEGAAIMVDEQLSQAGAHINAAAEAIVEKLQNLIKLLTPMEETWTGPAADYYGPLQQEWNYAANGLFGSDAQGGILGEIAAAMHVTWNNYSDAEWSNVSTWKPNV